MPIGQLKPGAYVKETSRFGDHSRLFIKRYGIDASAGEFNFHAFLESFSDSYASEWEKQSVFGRSDPMQFYGGTQRNISAQFNLVAANVLEAQFNLEACNLMAQVLYPRYSGGVISSTPLIGIKFENFICEDNDYLVGTIGNLTITPDFNNGVFGRQDYLTVNEEAAISIAEQPPFADGNEIYPKIISLSFDFTPLHRATLGWSKNSFSGDSFPYRNDIQADIESAGVNQALDAFNSAKAAIREEFEDALAKIKEVQDSLKAEGEGGTTAEGVAAGAPAGSKVNNTAPGGPQDLAGGQGQTLLLNGEEMKDDSEQKAKMKQLLKDNGFPVEGPGGYTLGSDLLSEMAFGGGLAPSDPK